MRIRQLIVAAAVTMGVSEGAQAHSLKHRLGGYRDNSGMTRQRVGFDATFESKARVADMTASTVNLVLTRDTLQDASMGEAEKEYDREIYGSGYRIKDAVSVTASQTWDRTTDTRVMIAYDSDRQVTTRTWSGGVSQWYRQETIRLGIDLSRTVVEQPEYRTLDYDSLEVGNPPLMTSTGSTLSVRHLATSTTIVDYSGGYVVNDNRPPSISGAVGVRQFLPPLDGAVHGTVTRAYNRGVITVDSTYGQVDAWIYDAAYLQNLWRGGRARLGYRYYREDETTRAYEDERVLGSDTVSLGFAQDLDKRAIDGLGVPVTVEAAAAHYANNDNVSARSYEVGLTAYF